MPRETKSNGRKDLLDRFYTPDNLVKKCLDLLDLTQFDCIIEPSAGMGNFSKYLPDCLSYDISPQGNDIIQADWLTLDKSQFKGNNILVCGNPPFGEQNTLAIKFFNESATFCNTIAFILPLSFKKSSIQNMLDLNFHLIEELRLDDAKFYLKNQEIVQVPCVFQVWRRSDLPRQKVRLKTVTDLFDFTTSDKADFRIQRVGGNAGKASFDLQRSASSNYFIHNKSTLSNSDFVNYINQLVFPTIEYTVGPKSLSKGELIQVIEENFPI